MKRWSDKDIEEFISDKSLLIGSLEEKYNEIIRQLQSDLAGCQKETARDCAKLASNITDAELAADFLPMNTFADGCRCAAALIRKKYKVED